MKASDYIVQYLIDRDVRHVFGYPGGMVTHLMDSLDKRRDEIASHLTYHEQGAAFAACGYAQAGGGVGVAYATSGPGATNLVTGICNAWFDSLPVVFITGQVNTAEAKGDFEIRQRGFQETDIVSMVAGVTKFAATITCADDLKDHLDWAFDLAISGRKGPTLLDIPMDVLRSDVDFPARAACSSVDQGCELSSEFAGQLEQALAKAQRPVILLGNGVKSVGGSSKAREVLEGLEVPVVSSMLAVDVMGGSDCYFGFIGAYGDRAANFIVAKSDLVLALGARMDVRQVGAMRSSFAPNAKILRVDIDQGELDYHVHDDETGICADALQALESIGRMPRSLFKKNDEWLGVCRAVKKKLADVDDEAIPNAMMSRIGSLLPRNAMVMSDVGQNQVWVAQSLGARGDRKIFTSGGHGSMGYSLPAAIGCCHATGEVVYSFNGDGGIQMNIQELQTIAREQLPVKIIIFNNSSLGMIRHFQEMYFDRRYVQTVSEGGYTTPDFEALAKAYGINYASARMISDIDDHLFDGKEPCIVEIKIEEYTYVLPKLEFGKPNQDQEPLIDRSLYKELMAL